MVLFIGSVGLGLSTSLSCAVTCLPVYLPFSLSAEGRRDWHRVGMLLVGRLAAYLIVGALTGALGSSFSAAAVSRASAIAIIPLSLLLFLKAAGLFTREIRLCALMAAAGERIRSPLIVGFLLGFTVCYPFLIIMAVAATAGGALGGMVAFAGFFVGTSAFLVPLFLLPLVRGKAVRDWLNRFSSALAGLLGLFFLARALMLVFPATTLAPVVTEADVRALFPDASNVKFEATESPRYYRVSSGPANKPTLVGFAVASAECATDISGYGGPIPVLLAVDPAGKLRSVTVLANLETPSYVSRLFSKEYLGKFAGKSYSDPFQVGADVDAVTGATVSLTALTQTIRQTLNIFSTRILHRAPPPARQPGPAVVTPALLSFLALAALSLAVLFFGLRLRSWFLLLSATVLGLIFNFSLSIADVVRALFSLPWSVAEQLPRLVLIGIALAATLALGRHYCSMLCPYGALQELLYIVSPLKRQISAPLDRVLRAGKYVLLITIPFLFALSRNLGVLAFEPFAATFRALTSITFLEDLIATQFALFALLLVVLAANLITERFYCKYLCPLGALFALLSPARLIARQRFMTADRTCAGCSKGLSNLHAECFTCGGRPS